VDDDDEEEMEGGVPEMRGLTVKAYSWPGPGACVAPEPQYTLSAVIAGPESTLTVVGYDHSTAPLLPSSAYMWPAVEPPNRTPLDTQTVPNAPPLSGTDVFQSTVPLTPSMPTQEPQVKVPPFSNTSVMPSELDDAAYRRQDVDVLGSTALPNSLPPFVPGGPMVVFQ
jgi:hypothetical protein